MTKHQFFAVGSAVIFLLERALPALTNLPLFFFPVFVILFFLTSKNHIADLPYVAVAALFFDFFSGYRFGFFTAAILTTCLLMHLFKSRISVNTQSFFSLFFYSLFFIFGFLILLSFQPRLFMISWLPILIETVAISLLIFLYPYESRKIQN